MRRIGELAEAIVATLIVLTILGGPAWILLQVPSPLQDDGLRHEPEPRIGVPVATAYGHGVIVREVRYGDGPRWQVRLGSGRHVVVYRAQMEVRASDGS